MLQMKFAKFRMLKYCRKGMKALSSGNYDSALNEFRSAREITPAMITPRIMIVLTHYVEGQFWKCLKRYDEVLSEIKDWDSTHCAEHLNFDTRQYLKCYLDEVARSAKDKMFGSNDPEMPPSALPDYSSFDKHRVPWHFKIRFPLSSSQ